MLPVRISVGGVGRFASIILRSMSSIVRSCAASTPLLSSVMYPAAMNDARVLTAQDNSLLCSRASLDFLIVIAATICCILYSVISSSSSSRQPYSDEIKSKAKENPLTNCNGSSSALFSARSLSSSSSLGLRSSSEDLGVSPGPRYAETLLE